VKPTATIVGVKWLIYGSLPVHSIWGESGQ